jgi:hypothetical protein
MDSSAASFVGSFKIVSIFLHPKPSVTLGEILHLAAANGRSRNIDSD